MAVLYRMEQNNKKVEQKLVFVLQASQNSQNQEYNETF